MSAFRDQVREDWDVFINEEEFADLHNLNGIECRAILQDTSSVDDLTNSASRRTVPHYDLYGSTVIVHCRTEDLPEIPVYGQTFTVDDKLYLVQSVVEAMGILTIALEANDR